MFELINRNCPICDKNHGKNKLLGMLTPNNSPFKEDSSLKFPLTKCNVCDMIYLSEIPKKNDLFKCYTEQIQFTCDAYTGKRVPLILQYFSHWLNHMVKYSNLDKNNLTTLEIGGGLSWMSRVVKNFNKNNFTVVQDLTKECLDKTSWVDKYYTGDLHEVIDSIKQHQPYQIISMSHVFEHLIEPLNVLRICNEILDDRGIIFINSPHKPEGWNDSSPFSDWEKWSYNHVPTHLNYFNNTNLQKGAEKVNLKVVFFEAKAENGQAYEVWFRKKIANK